MAVVRRRSAPHTGRSRGAEQTVVEPYGFPRRVQLRGAGHRSVVRARRGLRGLRIKKGIGMICVALSPRAAGTRFTRRVRHPSRPKFPRTPQRAETSIESVFTREQRGGACSPEQNGTAHNAAALPLQLRPCHGCRVRSCKAEDEMLLPLPDRGKCFRRYPRPNHSGRRTMVLRRTPRLWP